MRNTLSIETDPAFIRPLGEAQNELLQVLLPTFSIRHKERGLELEVEFDFDSPAVWLRRGKNYVRRQLNPASTQQYQEKLEGILLGDDTADWTHEDAAFPFRYGNGGTLPVIRSGDRDYYCFFYREIAPIGWNIANGGAESVAELLEPTATIERELREELIIIEPSAKPSAGHRYVFDWNEGRRADHPDFAIARRFWHEIFQKRDFRQLGDVALPLKWLPAHDSVIIKFGNESPIEVKNCLLNINAEDFGIEIDRVAKMAIRPEAVLCDGEVVRGNLLNRVIGLFEVNRFNAAMAAGRKEFLPDRVFWSGRERSKGDVHAVVREYLDTTFERRVWAMDVRPEYEAATRKFGLCPVTRNLIRRYLLLEEPCEAVAPSTRPPTPRPSTLPEDPDIFLSFASEDLALARQVFSFLQDAGRSVFFSEETLHHANFGDAIDTALGKARSLVVVGTKPERFSKPWVQYEWQSFHNDILGGRKPWGTPLVTLVPYPERDRDVLPRPLVFRQIVACDPTSPASALQKLDDLLRTAGL